MTVIGTVIGGVVLIVLAFFLKHRLESLNVFREIWRQEIIPFWVSHQFLIIAIILIIYTCYLTYLDYRVSREIKKLEAMERKSKVQ